MKKYRKLTATFLAVLLAVALFFGLSGNDENITVVRIWTADGQNKLLMTRKVDEFNETTGKEKGIKIEYRVIRDGIDAELLKAAKNNDLPELFGGAGSSISQLRREGKCVPINALPGGRELLIEKAPEKIVPLSQDGGEHDVYSIPVRKITGRLIYNKDLFKKAGIVDSAGNPTPPETWDEFIEYSKRIHDCDPTKFGTAFPLVEPGVMSYSLSWAVRSSLPSIYACDFENKTCRNMVTETIMNILERIKNDGSCFPGIHTLNNDTLRHQFAQGNIGMFLACSWDVGVLTEQFPAKCNWGVAPYPTLEKGKVYQVPQHESATMSIGISALETPEKKAAVMEVFRWLYSDEMLLEHYRQEQWIPIDDDIRARADESKMSEQWLAFCKEPKITGESKPSPPLTVGSPGWTYIDVWTGKISFDEAIRRANDAATKAFRQGLADGTINYEIN